MSRKICIFLYIIIFINLCLTIETDADIASVRKRSNNDLKESSIVDREFLGKFIVSIRYRHLDEHIFGNGHFCGGIIITRLLILTASYCIHRFVQIGKNVDPPVYVVIGTNKLYEHVRTTQIININKMFVHPDYDSEKLHHNIGVISLTQLIKIDGKTTGLASLPHKPVMPLAECTIAGWGAVREDGPRSNDILYAELTILSESNCKAQHPEKVQGELCATPMHERKVDICEGDTGGPLFCDGVVVGIISRQYPCSLKNASGIYTDVYYYMSWINSDKDQASTMYCYCHLLDLCIFYIMYSVF